MSDIPLSYGVVRLGDAHGRVLQAFGFIPPIRRSWEAIEVEVNVMCDGGGT